MFGFLYGACHFIKPIQRPHMRASRRGDQAITRNGSAIEVPSNTLQRCRFAWLMDRCLAV
jgi:hypothetical protein